MRNKEQSKRSIAELKQGLLALLQDKSYKLVTADNYRRTLSLLETYMNQNKVDTYSSLIGTAFVTDYHSNHNLHISQKRAIVTIVNRLNDYYSGTEFTLQRKNVKTKLPEIYDGLLKFYLSYCKKKRE